MPCLSFPDRPIELELFDHMHGRNQYAIFNMQQSIGQYAEPQNFCYDFRKIPVLNIFLIALNAIGVQDQWDHVEPILTNSLRKNRSSLQR